jgi:hypothetical protein
MVKVKRRNRLIVKELPKPPIGSSFIVLNRVGHVIFDIIISDRDYY